MTKSPSLARLQTGALIIRTFHWQRRQGCNIFCTILAPGLLFILVNVLTRALITDDFVVIDFEEKPKGAFSPKPFNPATCIFPDGVRNDMLEFSNLTEESKLKIIRDCMSSSSDDSFTTFKPDYIVPIYSDDSISTSIGSHSASNPTNNTGLLSQFSLDQYEYPPALVKDGDKGDENSNYTFEKNNFTFPLKFDQLNFSDITDSILSNLTNASRNSAIDRSFGSKTRSYSSKSALYDFLYDYWRSGNLADRIFTAFTFDSYTNNEDSVSLSTTVFWNETQPFETEGCRGLCPMLSSISNLYSALYSSINPGKSSHVYLRKMPKVNPYDEPQFIQLILSIFIVLLTHTSFPWTLYFLVYERSSRMRDYMMAMGLSKRIYWIGTYVSLYLFYILSIISIYIFGRATQTSFFVYNSPVPTLLLFLLWGNALISLGIFLEPFFSDPQTAQIFGWLLVIAINFLGGPFIGEKVGNDNTSTGSWIAMMLLPSFAYMRSIYYTGAINESGEGIHITSTIVRGIDLGMCNGRGPYCWSYGFLIFDTILLLVLAAYVRYILGMIKSGMQLHPLFFLGFQNKNLEYRKKLDANDHIENVNIGEDVREEERKVKEIVNGNISDFKGVVINEFSKTYMSKTPVHAVNKISLVTKPNEVLTILGHNGAGKSTLFKCLVGEIKASDGEAYINGYSINKDSDKIHKNMGLVTQENIFWHDMNVSEHLYFFGRVKGVTRNDLKQAVEESLENVQLIESRKKLIKRLSGGMKRRLLVSIAMMGQNCKYVILDEPSTGLDLVSRERLWGAINKMKLNKSIILTTHSLEEAEMLSSRIAILSNGQLKCIGTADDLKLRLGDGHRLVISLSSSSSINNVMSAIHDFLPSAVLDTVVGSNIEVVLSRDTHLTKILKLLNEKKASLGIRDWAVQQSSLEDVFLKVTRNNQREVENRPQTDNLV